MEVKGDISQRVEALRGADAPAGAAGDAEATQLRWGDMLTMESAAELNSSTWIYSLSSLRWLSKNKHSINQWQELSNVMTVVNQ